MALLPPPPHKYLTNIDQCAQMALQCLLYTVHEIFFGGGWQGNQLFTSIVHHSAIFNIMQIGTLEKVQPIYHIHNK